MIDNGLLSPLNYISYLVLRVDKGYQEQINQMISAAACAFSFLFCFTKSLKKNLLSRTIFNVSNALSLIIWPILIIIDIYTQKLSFYKFYSQKYILKLMSHNFEDPNFDAIAYLNNRFPDQDSLAELDDEISKLNTELESVNKQLIDQIHEHAMMNVQIGEEIKKAKTLSKEIIAQIGTIKQKAKKSEEIVYDMCKDLKSLDIAKKNLTFSIDALKKFIMMVDAIQKLREACQAKKYPEVANLLSAFDGLSNHFKKYQQIPQIQELYKDKNSIVDELYAQITQDFEAYQNDSSLLTAQNMTGAANVIEVLGPKFFRKFVTAMNQIILKQYQEQFGTPENSVLENTERRYGFIKRKMQAFYTKYGKIFPPKWGLDCLIYYQFCSITRLHLTISLERTFETVNVAVLMKSLEISINFQNKITKTMNQKYGEQIKKQNKGPCDLQALPKFTGSISNSFQPYLKPYIKSQEDALYDGLQKSLENDDLTAIKVYNSSVVLFHGIKNTIRRASMYSRGNLLIDIVRVVKKMLKINSQKCFEKTRKGGSNFQETVCCVINTGEYLKNTIEGVRQILQQTIDETYRQYIDFKEQEEIFSNLISKSIQLLISTLESKLQACFIQLTKVQWDQYQDFGEESRYIKDAKEIIKSSFLKIKDELQSVYLTLYVDKVVVLVANKFIQNILKCKKLPETAYQVLLMDFTQLKETLLSIIKTDQQTYGTEKSKAKHTAFVNKTFSKGQNMIKLMGLKNEQFSDKFESMMEGATVVDLQKILQVRGNKKSQFPNLVKSLQNKYS